MFMNLNLVINVIHGFNFFKIGHFLRELSTFGHFGVKNDVIGQTIGKVVKKLFSKFFGKSISVRLIGMNLVKNVVNGANLVKICILFFLYFLVKIPIQWVFSKIIVDCTPSSHFFWPKLYFSKP